MPKERDADDLAARIAEKMLADEGTGPAWGVMVAEAREAALAGRSGVYHVAVRGEDGRAIAEFQGYSRTIGGAVIGDE